MNMVHLVRTIVASALLPSFKLRYAVQCEVYNQQFDNIDALCFDNIDAKRFSSRGIK